MKLNTASFYNFPAVFISNVDWPVLHPAHSLHQLSFKGQTDVSWPIVLLTGQRSELVNAFARCRRRGWWLLWLADRKAKRGLDLRVHGGLCDTTWQGNSEASRRAGRPAEAFQGKAGKAAGKGGRAQALHRHALTQACQLKFGQQRNKCLCEIMQWLLNMMFSCKIWQKFTKFG